MLQHVRHVAAVLSWWPKSCILFDGYDLGLLERGGEWRRESLVDARIRAISSIAADGNVPPRKSSSDIRKNGVCEQKHSSGEEYTVEH